MAAINTTTGTNTGNWMNAYTNSHSINNTSQNTNVNFVVGGGYKTTYVILGEEVSISGYKDIQLASCIAQINILGKPYYDELIKQGITFSDEIEKVLARKFIEFERDRKIDLVTKKD
jgi:hypothetical protein